MDGRLKMSKVEAIALLDVESAEILAGIGGML
jgi:hypothetical protein